MGFFKKFFKKNETIEQPKVAEEVNIEQALEERQKEVQAEEALKETQSEGQTEEVPKEVPAYEKAKEVLKEAPTEEEEVLKEAQSEENQEALEELQAEEQAEQALEDELAKEQVELALEEEKIEEQAEEVAVEEQTVVSAIEQPTEPKKSGFFSKLFSGLSKTRDNLIGAVDDVLKQFKKIDEDLYEELEETLIMADFGVETTMNIMEALRKMVKERKITEPQELKSLLQEIITGILTKHETTPLIVEGQPNVILVIGVNGVGKTTTIGKLAHQFKGQNKKVVLAAADTFRAAAIEQLQIWADRAGVDLIKHDEGSDPASVVFDGIKAAKSRKADILICDTAGRLQNKANLMKELEKIARIIEREYPEAHKEVVIVLDATTGQNAISQVKVFKEVAKVDGIILTKLDGTAKGGAVVGICENLGVPVKYIGVGEKIDDLQVFNPQAFAEALFVQNEK